jgi:hypothetical protein
MLRVEVTPMRLIRSDQSVLAMIVVVDGDFNASAPRKHSGRSGGVGQVQPVRLNLSAAGRRDDAVL